MCGIHPGGCGKPVSMENAEVGHIIPKAMVPRGHPYDEYFYDEYFHRQVRKELRKRRGETMAIDVNVQPMHRECNQRMEAIFPPQPIVSHCTCCTWIYVVSHRDTYYWPVETWMGAELPDSLIPREFLLVRRYETGKGQIQIVGFELTNKHQFGYADGSCTEPALMMVARGKNRIGAWAGAGRADITMQEMLAHNMSLTEEERNTGEVRLAVAIERGDLDKPGGRHMPRQSAQARKVCRSTLDERERMRSRDVQKPFVSGRLRAVLTALNLCEQHPQVVGQLTEMGSQGLFWQGMTEYYGAFRDAEGRQLRRELLQSMECPQKGARLHIHHSTNTRPTSDPNTIGLHIAENFRKYEVLWIRTVVKREGGRGWVGNPAWLLWPSDEGAKEREAIALLADGILERRERIDFLQVIEYTVDWLKTRTAASATVPGRQGDKEAITQEK